MIASRAALGALAILLASHAAAQEAADQHLRREVYSPVTRTRLPMTTGRTAIVAFGPGEDIKRVVTGTVGIIAYPTAQEVQSAPLGNNLPLWAENVGRTTLQVITARADGPDRVYQIDVFVRPVPACEDASGEKCQDHADSTYGLTYTYPDDERSRRNAETAAARQAAGVRAASTRAQREHAAAVARLTAEPSCVNGDYWGQGDRAIVPDDACDDGQSVALLFRGNRPVPAVFVIDPDGKERAVRVSQRGDWTILPVMRERIVLRLGQSVVNIKNNSYDHIGREPATGTPTPDVIRQIVRAGAE